VCLVDRVAFRHAVVDGLTAGEFEPAGKAAGEVGELYAWLCGQLHMPARGPVDTSTKHKVAA
jgi:chromosome partitioning protein